MCSSWLRFALALPIASTFAITFGSSGEPQRANRAATPSWAPGARIPEEQFEGLHKLICPQATESKWARLPWMWDLMEARKKAVAADKPLLFWRAGGGDPLGRA
jgi:hypothetical protein